MLASCGDDCCVLFYDIRQPHSASKLRAHEKEVNTIQFHPQERYLFVTASSDSTLALWDHRNLSAPLHVLRGHKAEIFSASWNPTNKNLLASSGVDRRVMLWDLSRVGKDLGSEGQIGESLPPEQEAEGPPELVFVHAGHTAKVNDICWNPDVKSLLWMNRRMSG